MLKTLQIASNGFISKYIFKRRTLSISSSGFIQNLFGKRISTLPARLPRKFRLNRFGMDNNG